MLCFMCAAAHNAAAPHCCKTYPKYSSKSKDAVLNVTLVKVKVTFMNSTRVKVLEYPKLNVLKLQKYQ